MVLYFRWVVTEVNPSPRLKTRSVLSGGFGEVESSQICKVQNSTSIYHLRRLKVCRSVNFCLSW